MKSPMNQRPDDQARADTEEFIAKHARAEKVTRAAREKQQATVTQAEPVTE
jgi:myo-inositol-1-phosphate synthase